MISPAKPKLLFALIMLIAYLLSVLVIFVLENRWYGTSFSENTLTFWLAAGIVPFLVSGGVAIFLSALIYALSQNWTATLISQLVSVLFVLFLILYGNNAALRALNKDSSEGAATEAQVICSQAKQELQGLAESTPLRLDAATLLMGAWSNYADGRCYIEYRYTVEESHFIAILQEGARSREATNLTTEDAIAYANSTFGRERMVTFFEASVSNDARELSRHPMVQMRHRFVFDGGRISPVEFVLE